MVQDIEVVCWRLRSQRPVPPHAASAVEAVGSLLAVQDASGRLGAPGQIE